MIEFKYGEKWCSITGYEGKYMVSSWGRVWSHVTKSILSQTYKNKYLAVTLSRGSKDKKTFTVHVLVAKEFIGPAPAPGMYVHHRDHNKANCRASNLAWETPSDNQYHRYRHYAKSA